MKYSVVILLDEENEDFPDFVRALHSIFSERREPFEILIMASGTEGFLRQRLEEMENINGRIRAFALHKGTVQAICLKAAMREASGEIIVVCGPYQQITEESFALLLDSMDEETDIVIPWRQERVDAWINQVQSRVFNELVRKINKTDFHDLSSIVRVFRREVIEETDLYGNMYRFLPILAARKGFKGKEVKCRHYQERGKTGFYSIAEYATRIIDILTVYFNTRFTRKPLRFFSILGSLFLISGLSITGYAFFQKIFFGYPIGGRAVLLLALLFTVLGVQAASFGLLGEILAFTHGRQKREYTIEKEL